MHRPLKIEMMLPELFYAEPRFRASSPDFAKLNEATELTLDTPGADLALALDYYRVEAFASERDRDAGCGPTAHKDVQYFPAKRENLIAGGTTLVDIACGHRLDHSQFVDVLTPIFDAALKRLIGDVMQAPKGQSGMIASTAISIARTRYMLSAVAKGDWLDFPVEGFAVFEKANASLIDRTICFLQNRLILQMSPSLIDAECN